MFLKYVAPQKLQYFYFGGDYDTTNINELVEIKYYSKALHKVVKSTLFGAAFEYCRFSSSELQSLFSHASHIECLWFRFCILDVDDGFDLKEQDYNLVFLQLHVTRRYNGWSVNLDKLEILVKAIANSSLMYSLKQIDIDVIWTDLDYKEKAKKIFERHGIQHLLLHPFI